MLPSAFQHFTQSKTFVLYLAIKLIVCLYFRTFPTVVTRPKTQTVSQGSTIEIHCEATGVPSPTIKWTRIGEAFAPHIQQVGPVLKLQNVQVRDRGVYICVASNSAGVAQDSSIVEIERNKKNRF